jgi:AcrR family transcriptional regulator
LNTQTPRQRRYRRRQEAILTAAREIIRDEGINALSMRAIAERIDYSAATLYEYFASKEEIVEAVCGQGQRVLRDYLAAVDEGLPTLEYFHKLGLAYIRFALENPDYFLIMFTFAGPRKSHDAEMEERIASAGGGAGGQAGDQTTEESAYAILVAAVRRAVDEGVFRTRPGFGVMEMSYAAWSIVHGIAMLRVAHIGMLPMPFEHLDAVSLHALTRGFQS